MGNRARQPSKLSFCATCAWLLFAYGCQSPFYLTVEDHVCRAGDDIDLVGKLEYRGVYIFNKGTDDRRLLFYLDGRPLGDDETNDEGFARVGHEFDRPGTHRLVVAYDRDGTREAEASATVFVWGKREPVLIVDVDHTVADTRTRDLLSTAGVEQSEPFPQAAEVLRDLGQSFHVVYLTGRPREFFPKTREWLQRHGFPPGPLLTWDMDRDPWSPTDYKRERIHDLQDRFDAVRIGIGDRSFDREAYTKRKLFAIMLDDDDLPRRVNDVVYVPDWTAVRELFARNPQLFSPTLRRDERVALPLP